MDLPVKLHNVIVGKCSLEEKGLYWSLQCRCELVSDKVERLYVGEKKLGVLEKDGDTLFVKRMVSKSSYPELPPQRGYLTLHPQTEEMIENETKQTWEGDIMGNHLVGIRDGDEVLFPYDPTQPCPCEPLVCFFEIRDGFWRIPIKQTIKNETLPREEDAQPDQQ